MVHCSLQIYNKKMVTESI